jgi:hypothetical protein
LPNLAAEQSERKIISTRRVALLDDDVLALNVTERAQAAPERIEFLFIRPGCPHESNAGDLGRMLRARTSGHAAAPPPRKLMNSRRHPSSGAGIVSAQTSNLIGLKLGIKTIAAVHSQCRRWVLCHE